MSPDNKGLSVHHYSLSSKKEKAMFYGVKGKIQSQAHLKPFLKVFCLKQESLSDFLFLPSFEYFSSPPSYEKSSTSMQFLLFLLSFIFLSLTTSDVKSQGDMR